MIVVFRKDHPASASTELRFANFVARRMPSPNFVPAGVAPGEADYFNADIVSLGADPVRYGLFLKKMAMCDLATPIFRRAMRIGFPGPGAGAHVAIAAKRLPPSRPGRHFAVTNDHYGIDQMDRRLSDRGLPVVAGAAAFAAYFAMYAFRKPIAAAAFDDVGGWGELGYKGVLLVAQVMGYALSKLLGVKIIAEFGRRGRAWAIALLVGMAWGALVLFALLPASLGPAALFLNGLPLGLIWGLVISFVEGRRTSDLIGAILCASFIMSSGFVKSVGVLLMQAGVSPWWMPAATGILFMPVLGVAVGILSRLPPPDAADEAARAPRVAMDAADRRRFLAAHGLPMLLLVTAYVLLTALRDLRDNFAAEIWAALGYPGQAAMFSASELPIGLAVLAALAGLVAVRSNARALLLMHGAILAGAALLGLSTLAFGAGLLSPLGWMILSGAGLYLAYTPFNAMLFDRLIAFFGAPGNAGFLIYVADAAGYAGSVALLLWRSFGAGRLDWLHFFMTAAQAGAVAVVLLAAGSAWWFARMAAGARSHAAVTGRAAAMAGD